MKIIFKYIHYLIAGISLAIINSTVLPFVQLKAWDIVDFKESEILKLKQDILDLQDKK